MFSHWLITEEKAKFLISANLQAELKGHNFYHLIRLTKNASIRLRMVHASFGV